MIRRCENKEDKSYSIYGRRGIKVCRRWKNFGHFINDMGPRPPNTTLDRIDVDGNYTKKNCRWATHEQQQNNRKNNRKFFDGKEWLSIAQLSRRHKINHTTLQFRIDNGWSIREAIETRPALEKYRDLFGMSLNQKCKQLGIKTQMVVDRIHAGWTIDEALHTPKTKF